MVKNEYTYDEFIKEYPDDDACLEKVFQMTYGKMEKCPNPSCKNPHKGYVRVKGRLAYQCRVCYNFVYPLKNTVFSHTHINLTKWFYAIFVFTTSKNGISALEISRAVGVSPKTGLRMLKRIREEIHNDENPLSNEVECDEAMVGGLNKNRHKNKRYKGTGGRSTVDKSLVFGMMERGGRVIAKVLDNARQETIHPVIFEFITKGSDLLTDEFTGYNNLGHLYNHESCNHKLGIYKSGNASTNCMENFWSCLKRTMKSYISVSRKYLPLYVKEVVFRHNFRGSNNMFRELLSCLIF
jgi:transposase-like protein